MAKKISDTQAKGYSHRKRYLNTLFITLTVFYPIHAQVTSEQHVINSVQPVREKILMDFGWRFANGHAYDVFKDFNHSTSYFSYFAKSGYGDGPADPEFDDRGWRILDVPHDWAVELPFDSTGGYSHGYKAIGPNFPENSIGWYRKSFFIPAADSGKRISILFDGVFRNSSVFVNGFYLGQEHSGYAGFQYDISDYLNFGGENVVAVRVEARMEEGWFYEGAGIYRHVWLIKTGPLHITQDGIFITSEVENKSATLKIRTSLINEINSVKTFNICYTIINAEGKEIVNITNEQLSLNPAEENEFFSKFTIPDPQLWSPDSPYLYKVLTKISAGGEILDVDETVFGIRTLYFDSEKGFFLNGKHVKLKGTNNHQDHAGVGVAIPDALQTFRVAQLKGMGANAYRCSHNPPTPELLDACDKLGMFVIVENRLMGSNKEHLDLLERMIIRNRNHPSVILWSLGNEEWAIEGNDYGARIGTTMQQFAQRLDSSRRYTIAGSGGWGHGISTVVDVMGFNYIFNGDIDRQHAEFPNQPSVGTEETTSRSTRGIYVNDPSKGYLAQIDRIDSPEHSIETGFKFYEERPFLAGIFYWTGFDYRGEPNPYGWPQIGSQSGIMDQCGYPKDMYYYLQSWWTENPVLHILPNWNNPVPDNQEVNVWVYSNCDEVELFLNKQSLGRKAMPKFSHLEWRVNYQPGVLVAKGYSNGKLITSTKQETTGEPRLIKMQASKVSIKADGEDVSVISVWVEDTKCRSVPTAQNEIVFSTNGPGKIIGVGNGNPSSHEADRFFERVERIKIENMKKASLKNIQNPPEAFPDFDYSGWEEAFTMDGFESRATEDTWKYIIFRGSFFLEPIADSAEITLLAKSICDNQSLYINGHLIVEGVKREQPAQSYILDQSMLHTGENVFVATGLPLKKRNTWEYLNTDPGLIRIVTPPDSWKRKLFSGLAQVIIQSEKLSGDIKLTANSPGLENAQIRLLSTPTDIRPAMSNNYSY
jgi:beta-galactosidase